MPVPNTTRQGHHPVVEGQGVVVTLGDAAQAFGPVDGVFYLHESARMGAVVGALHIGISVEAVAPGYCAGVCGGANFQGVMS